MDLQSVDSSPFEVQKTVVLLPRLLRCLCLVLREGFRWPGQERWLQMSRPGNRSRPGRWRIAFSGKSWVCPWSGWLKSLCWTGPTYWFLRKNIVIYIYIWIKLLILHVHTCKGVDICIIMAWHVMLSLHNRNNLLIFFQRINSKKSQRHVSLRITS